MDFGFKMMNFGFKIMNLDDEDLFGKVRSSTDFRLIFY